jgi:predicted regulator of Ras-like GTPase activity (Roadblock/LC7/MglB family)
MQEQLERIKAVSGVSGSFVCDEDGEVLGSALGRDVDSHRLHLVTRTLAQTMAGLRSVQRRRPGGLDILYAKGRLLIKPMSGGSLAILCSRQVNIPLLNLTANVAVRKIGAELRNARKQAKEAEAVSSPEDAEQPDASQEPEAGGDALQRFLRPFGR